MATRFDLVTIDSPDTDALAAFWSAALDLHEVEREDGNRWIVLADGDGTRRLGIQRGVDPSGLDPPGPVVCARRLRRRNSARLVALGATQLAELRREPYGSIVNLADPDGNPFDLCAYG